MSKQIFKLFTVSKSFWILFFSLTLGSFTKANPYTDTSKKDLTATSGNFDNGSLISPETNIVFPDVLTGNENEMLLYIEKFSVNKRAYIIRTYNRSQKYFPKVTAVLKKHGLPDELKMLLPLESAFNANAVSKAGAVGYWQFMDAVAREYGLKYVSRQHTTQRKKQSKKQAHGRDDRKNFTKSTYAAARYLKDRSRNLNNDLLLMVASYNCGVGNVWEAMKKTGLADPDFWDIKDYLPAETQTYVMNFITLNVIFHNYEKFANNTLNFKPTIIRLDNFENNMTEPIEETSSVSKN